MIYSYEDLTVYRRSYRLSIELYKETRAFPKEEMYSFTSQLRRAVTSIPLNIAEGYGKHQSEAEFKRFLQMAMGSANEVSVLLSMSADFGYMTEAKADEYRKEIKEIGSMLRGLYDSWRNM